MDNTEDRLSERIEQRKQMQKHPLATIPDVNKPHGRIPNTPLAVATVSFLLGWVFLFGVSLIVPGGLSGHWWTTYQLGFFIAAWAGFHWGEFAVTAGWNLHKCSIDCKCWLLFNQESRIQFVVSFPSRQWLHVSYCKWHSLG